MPSALHKLITLGVFLLLSSQSYAEPLASSQLEALTEKANNGDISSRVELADRYHTGKGVTKNLKQAAILHTQLAKDEVAQSQMTLAFMYIRGEGVEKNKKQALHWLTKAAEQRLAPAQYFLGIAYAEGHGVEIDNITAYMWYEIAAAMEYKDAIDATKTLALKMNEADILTAEVKATEWWMRFHH